MRNWKKSSKASLKVEEPADSVSAVCDDDLEDKVKSVQSEILLKLSALVKDVEEMRAEAEDVKKAVTEHREQMSAQDGVIVDLETRVKELSQNQKRNIRKRLQQLVSVNAYVSGMLDSN